MQDLLVATCRSQPDLWHDDQGLPAAMATHGWNVVPRPWQDIDPGKTPVLVRTPWDYGLHREAFTRWLHALGQETPCINPADVMLWNLDKRYLAELGRRGCATIPTLVLDRFEADAVRAVGAAHGWDQVVAKPVIGCAAQGLVVVGPEGVRTFDARGNTWAPDTPSLPEGRVLVQPVLDMEGGEWSLHFFGGAFSHAVLKRPAPGDLRVQEEHGGTTRPGHPPAPVLDAARDVVGHVPTATYARVDGVVVGDRFLLMEVELVEPELYFRYAPGAMERFAAAVAGSLARLAL